MRTSTLNGKVKLNLKDQLLRSMRVERERKRKAGKERLRRAMATLTLILALWLAPGSTIEAWADVYDVDEIANAVYRAEGGVRAKKPYGILSVPCDSEVSCRKICLNTIENNFTRWQADGAHGDFIEFLGSRYAPVSAHSLNKHWVKNVKHFLGGKQ